MIKRNFLNKICVLITIVLIYSCSDPIKYKQDWNFYFFHITDEVKKNSRAYETLEYATKNIGHRLTGSENGRKAEEYAHKLFEKYGYDSVYYQEFEMTAWTRDNVSLEVYESITNIEQGITNIEQGITNKEVRNKKQETRNKKPHSKSNTQHSLKTVSLAHAPEFSDITDTIIDTENGLTDDFEKYREIAKNNIVLINIGIHPQDTTLENLHRSEKTALAIEFGATGIIFINTVEGEILLTGTASVTGELISIPAVCISLEDGLALRKKLSVGNTILAHIRMKNTSKRTKARNIIATFVGKDLPNERIIIGGHLDSWDLATGATDNGLGSFSILEIARIFRAIELKPRRTIQFILFMGEEQGLHGSKAFVKQAIEQYNIDEIRYMLNLDMAGNTIGFDAGGRDEMEPFIKGINKMIHRSDTAFKGKYSNGVGLHSDHQPFMMEGIPTLGNIGNLDPYIFRFYHSNKDDFNLINREHMNNCCRFTAMMLFALADCDEIAAKRQTQTEVRDMLIKANLKEKLILGKEWRWEH